MVDRTAWGVVRPSGEQGMTEEPRDSWGSDSKARERDGHGPRFLCGFDQEARWPLTCLRASS